MRIGVLRTQVPFVTGGAERHASNLVTALNAYGHEAVEITLPFKWYPGDVLTDHVISAKLLDLSEVEGVKTDMVIGLKFPAYLAPHPNKLFWIIHQHRQAYDMWETGQSDLLDDPDGLAVRQLIMEEDRAAFAASPHPIYANSRNVADRLSRFLGIEASPLYHPPPNADRMMQGDYGDYLFAPGRINPSKRLDLILRGLAAAPSRLRLVVAGVAENPAYQSKLHKLALELGIDRQVTWLGPVDDDTLLRTYADARAVVFTPQDEDYGYITLEAMLAAKPVITVTDAGGPLEFIRDRREGLIASPTSADLGQAFEKVMGDAASAEAMGQAGLVRYKKLQIGWEHVVKTLSGAIHAPPAPDTAPPQDGTDANPQLEAVRRLAAAIAPPEPPEQLPFASIEEVLEAYAFDELPRALAQEEPAIDRGLADYLGTHWTRFVTTLRTLDGLTPRKTLDVGVFPPLVFQSLLINMFPGIAMTGLWEGPAPYRQTVRPRNDRLPSFDIRLEPANSERDRWPFNDGSFDLVTGMEILEHLALDPYFFFAEANRVLEPGGHLLLTTPNVVSHRGVWKMLNGIAPYSFGIFVPSGGVYGRHNREYAPPELIELGEAAGFETVSLATVDVYDRKIDPGTAELLAGRQDDLALRGETIFYLARKTQNPKGVPARFYHGDPTRMGAVMQLISRENATGLIRIGVENRSRTTWPVAGPGGTCILAEWMDAEGDLRHQHLFQPLTAPLEPGAVQTISLRLNAGHAEGSGELRLHLYQIGVGVMTGSGRAPTLSMPCTEAGFLHLVKTMPRPEDPA